MKRRAQPWLGTLVDITILDESDERSERAFAAAFAEISLVHRLMSFHDPGSEISLINAALPGEILPVHPYTRNVLALASEIHTASAGAFNIGCAGRLMNWRQLPGTCRAFPAYEPLAIVARADGAQSVVKLAQGWIDVGGIAKGYAVDRATDVLRAHGITAACINAGGDLRVFGSHAFPVTIRDPACPGQVGKELLLENEAMATSAPYFSFSERDGQATSALCNGLSGAPIIEPISVSVRAPSCACADALTKVVLSTRNAAHPALILFQATSFIL